MADNNSTKYSYPCVRLAPAKDPETGILFALDLTTDEYGATFESVAFACGISEDQLTEALNRHDQGKRFDLDLGEDWRLVPNCDLFVSSDAITGLLQFFSNYNNPVALKNSLNLMNDSFYGLFGATKPKEVTLAEAIAECTSRNISQQNKVKPSNQSYEKEIQLRLARQHNGKIEVKTPSGRIDVLTEEYIIEVKEAGGWKGGIGQLMSYGHFYPDRKKKLCLFGECSDLETVRNVCKPLDIEVELEL